MKKETVAIKYSDMYNAILSKNINITFEEFFMLRLLKILDTRRTKFCIKEFDNESFGHFEIERDTPTYNYEYFFHSNNG